MNLLMLRLECRDMNEDEHELARLELERARLLQEVDRHQRWVRHLAWLAIVLAGLVTILLVLAIVAGQLSLQALSWSILLGGLIAYVVTREIRWHGKVAFVLEIIGMTGARDDIRDVRRRFASCEARIAALTGR
jgi:hypothetical protein